MKEVILLNSFHAFGVEVGEHGVVLNSTNDYTVAQFTKNDGNIVILYLKNEDFEYPDFTTEDKEWISKIDGSKLRWEDFE